MDAFIVIQTVVSNMSNHLKIKIHDVMHERGDYDINRAEEYIEEYIISADVVDVRIAPGPKNSPLFVTIDTRSLSMDAAKSIAREGVRGFSQFVDGVDVDSTVSEDNIKIITE